MSEFVEVNFMNSDTTKEIMAFMQIKGSLGDESAPEIAKFAQSKHWPLPDNDKVFALAMDPAGRELGRIEIDAKDPAGPKRAADFIRQHAPAPADARQNGTKHSPKPESLVAKSGSASASATVGHAFYRHAGSTSKRNSSRRTTCSSKSTTCAISMERKSPNDFRTAKDKEFRSTSFSNRTVKC
jgi:hypothetical protein